MKYPLLSACLLYAGTLAAQSISIDEKGIALEGQRVTAKTRYATIEKVLGRSDGEGRFGKMTTHYYAKKGLVIYVRSETQGVVAIMILMRGKQYDNVSDFTGKLTLSEIAVDTTLTVTRLSSIPGVIVEIPEMASSAPGGYVSLGPVFLDVSFHESTRTVNRIYALLNREYWLYEYSQVKKY